MPNKNQTKRYKKLKVVQDNNSIQKVKPELNNSYKVLTIIGLAILCIGAILTIIYILIK